MQVNMANPIKFNYWCGFFFVLLYSDSYLGCDPELSQLLSPLKGHSQVPKNYQNVGEKDVALSAYGSSFVAHTSELKMQKTTIVLHVWFVDQDKGLICPCFKSFFNHFKTWAKNSLQMGLSPPCYSLDLRISFQTTASVWKIPSSLLVHLQVICWVTWWRYLLDDKV